MLKTFSLLIVLSGLTSAQPVIAGLKIGVPLTDAFTAAQTQSVATAHANGYTLGPYIEVRLPFKFSIEADALYRGYKFSSAQSSSLSTSSWEFPVVAKYNFFKGPVRPYVEGGLAFSHLSDLKSLVVSPNHLNNFGVVIGGGVQIKALVLRISPEIRYTGYTVKDFSQPAFESNRNQLAFLVGIGF